MQGIDPVTTERKEVNKMLRDELFLRETIKRFNTQTIICEDTDDGRKKAVQFVNNMMFMLGIDKYRYRIKFDRMARDNGSLYDEVSLVETI